MKYKIVPNEERHTVTVVISPVVIPFVDYLYEKYDGKRYFAPGVLDIDFKTELAPMLKEIAKALNNVANRKKVPATEIFTYQDLIALAEDEYKLFAQNLDQDGVWDKKFKINLSSKRKTGEGFLYQNFKNPTPVDQDGAWKYNYAVEIELAPGYNEDRMEKYVFAIFHRAFAISERQDIESSYKENDSAWGGFEFEEEANTPQAPTKEQAPATKEESQAKAQGDLDEIDISEDDLPF